MSAEFIMRLPRLSDGIAAHGEAKDIACRDNDAPGFSRLLRQVH